MQVVQFTHTNLSQIDVCVAFTSFLHISQSVDVDIMTLTKSMVQKINSTVRRRHKARIKYANTSKVDKVGFTFVATAYPI